MVSRTIKFPSASIGIIREEASGTRPVSDTNESFPEMLDGLTTGRGSFDVADWQGDGAGIVFLKTLNRGNVRNFSNLMVGHGLRAWQS